MMNLYRQYSDPSKLKYYKDDKIYPFLMYEEFLEAFHEGFDITNSEIKEYENYFARAAETSFKYAKYFLEDRFLKGEPKILKSPMWAEEYAAEIIKDRWPLGEKIIATDAKASYYYAKNVLLKPFPKGEKVILKSPEYSKKYQKFMELIK